MIEISREEMIVLKMNLLGGMTEYLKARDPWLYASWVRNTLKVEELTEERLKEIAEDESAWRKACESFGILARD